MGDRQKTIHAEVDEVLDIKADDQLDVDIDTPDGKKAETPSEIGNSGTPNSASSKQNSSRKEGNSNKCRYRDFGQNEKKACPK